VNDYLSYAVPQKLVKLYIFYHVQQQIFLVGFMMIFAGVMPSTFLMACLFIGGDYTFYKNLEKMLK
tara:strand:+ start:572 stop:769 length:198 start_codon:yes stop_codon:yes gene_type:complete